MIEDPDQAIDADARRELVLSDRQLAYGLPEERMAKAQELQAARTPTALDAFALSTASSAAGLVLGGSILIVVADAVNLVHGVDVWPLVTLAVALSAAAAIALVSGYRRRAEDLLHSVTSPWANASRLERVEARLDELIAADSRSRAPSDT